MLGSRLGHVQTDQRCLCCVRCFAATVTANAADPSSEAPAKGTSVDGAAADNGVAAPSPADASKAATASPTAAAPAPDEDKQQTATAPSVGGFGAAAGGSNPFASLATSKPFTGGFGSTGGGFGALGASGTSFGGFGAAAGQLIVHFIYKPGLVFCATIAHWFGSSPAS